MERTPAIFDKIGSLIPGYSGYAEREGRRQCDKILRSQIASELQNCERLSQDKITDLIKEKKFDLLNSFENCRKRVDTLISKVRYASYGSSSFFSDAQIKENELQEIYKRDLLLMEAVQSLKASLQQSPSSESIIDILSNIDKMLFTRNQYLKEFK